MMIIYHWNSENNVKVRIIGIMRRIKIHTQVYKKTVIRVYSNKRRRYYTFLETLIMSKKSIDYQWKQTPLHLRRLKE